MAQALQAPLSKKHIPSAPEASLQNQKMWVAKEVKSTNHNTSQHSEPILVVSICFHFVNWIQLAQTHGGQHRAERRTQSRPLGWSLAIYRKSSWCTSCHTPDSDHCQAGQRIRTWQKKHRSGSFFLDHEVEIKGNCMICCVGWTRAFIPPMHHEESETLFQSLGWSCVFWVQHRRVGTCWFLGVGKIA